MRKVLLTWLLSFLIHWCYAQSLYSATGHASYYANKFEGRKTASGEIFSNKKMTAAHLTLPFGTIVKVTNLKNNKSVIVRINDRGPYIKGRIIDLSKVAADSLDMVHAGWVKVKVEELPPALTTKVKPPEIPLEDPSRLRFPEDWMGTWEGMLKIYSSRGLEKNLRMSLSILPVEISDRYTWTIVYDSFPRKYELVKRDSAGGVYSLDEKNGIDIISYVLGNHFLSRFSVMGNLLDCEYHLLSRDVMTFEIRSGKEERNWTTGNVAMKEDSIPEVSVFSINNLQVAELHRVKK